MATQRFESSVTAISWIPSEAITGRRRSRSRLGVTHYDDPPPDRLDDLEELRTSDRFREANELRAFIEVEDGRIVERRPSRSGPHRGDDGPGRAGRACGSRRSTSPTSSPSPGERDIGPVRPDRRRPDGPADAPARPPQAVRAVLAVDRVDDARPDLNADGTSSHELVGASPFPRHWIYDDTGRLVEKSGHGRLQRRGSTTRSAIGRRGARRTRRRSSPASSRRSSGRCRGAIMRGGRSRRSARSPPGERSSSRARPGTDVFLILDGIFVVEVDDEAVAEIGPGAVVGERAALLKAASGRPRSGRARRAASRACRAARWIRGAGEPGSDAPPRGVGIGRERAGRRPEPRAAPGRPEGSVDRPQPGDHGQDAPVIGVRGLQAELREDACDMRFDRLTVNERATAIAVFERPSAMSPRTGLASGEGVERSVRPWAAEPGSDHGWIDDGPTGHDPRHRCVQLHDVGDPVLQEVAHARRVGPEGLPGDGRSGNWRSPPRRLVVGSGALRRAPPCRSAACGCRSGRSPDDATRPGREDRSHSLPAPRLHGHAP